VVAAVTGSLVLAGAAGALSASATAGGGGKDPAGNNGTVKIDRLPLDAHPGNEPHVGCSFGVDFYGYDKGDLTATVTFEAQPPTLPAAGTNRVLRTDKVFVGEDSAAGGGSAAGLDAQRVYTLDLRGITPHKKQGVHVKLTVHAPGSKGADVKHKVFWVTGCAGTAPGSTPSTKPSATPSTTPSGGTKTPQTGPGGAGTPAPGGDTSCASSAADRDECTTVTRTPTFTG
jgi:hypothetical protein